MTIKEIAELANVSVGTVDRVIHNRGKVNAEKKARIEKIIVDNGFQPNVYARNLKLNRGTTIGYITPLLASEEGYWNLVYQGVASAQKDLKDMSMEVKVYEYDRFVPGSFLSVAERMVEEGVDACVIIAKTVDEATRFLSANPDLVYVLVDSEVEGFNPISVVGQNPYAGGNLAGRVLSLMSRDPKCFLSFSFRHSHISRGRISGFIRYCSERGISVLDYNIDTLDDIPSVLKDAFSKKHIDGIFVPFFAGYKVATDLERTLSMVNVPIVTYDLVSPNRRALYDGRISCVLSQRPVFQGYSAIWQVYRHMVLKQDIAQKVEVQIDILFKENLPEEFRASDRDSRSNQYFAPKETDFFWST